ncbi:hypothetical protein GS597_09840 [Synechococcales cyanobacterium C]|uniref:Uncharacterized protein n=1 Tax=Petrachloros mirabilis ULC683 TaxID=2781853 RepID=A0A8K2A830_9CYAN|nr:hypothetical protein [Petrachloros mirabilis]NCJ06804.1 hypothetical protein [Petrachloros mirabilis ULC683]
MPVNPSPALITSHIDLAAFNLATVPATDLAIQNVILAQAFEDNLGTTMQRAWSNFIESGQVWALLIGVVLGYLFRSLTAY